MRNTNFRLDYFNIEKIAVPYVWALGHYIKLPHIQTQTYALGGFQSTPQDMSHFLILYTNSGIYNGTRIIKETTIDQMFTLQYPDSYDGNARYGLGWYFFTGPDNEVFGAHGGLHPGYRAKLKIRLSDKTGVIDFWNQCHFVLHFLKTSPDDKIFYREIFKLLLEKADEIQISP